VRGVGFEPTKYRAHRGENPRQLESPSFNQALSDLVAFGLWMQRSGYRPSTVMSCIKALKAVARRSCIFDPESVKAYLVSAEMSESRKQTVVDHLVRYYRWKRLAFNRPRYKRIELLPFIPTEGEIDQLVSGLSPKWSAFVEFMKETDPESNIGKIHFHSFRTWRATMEYLKTRDLEAVMALLGATNPLHARRYVRLAQALSMREDDYVTARATNADEAEELVREGFNFVTEIQGVQVFRKERWLVEEPLKREDG